MADDKKSHGGAMKDLKWVIFILIIIWFIWYFSGGPQGYDATQPFIEPPAPLGGGQTYGGQ